MRPFPHREFSWVLDLAVYGAVTGASAVAAWVLGPRLDRWWVRACSLLRRVRWVTEERRFVALLLACVFVLLLFFAVGVLHNYPLSGDENCGIFLAKCFLMGRTHVPLHPLHKFFRASHVGEKDGKKFSVYPPAWPVALALGFALGVPWAVNPLLATATLAIFYALARAWYGREVATCALAATAGSAFFLFNSASYYSHAFTFFFLMVFAWCVNRLWEAASGASAFAAGAAVGIAFAARPLTALAFGAPFVLFVLWHAAARDKRFAWRHVAIAAAGAAVPVALFMAFNHSITESPFTPPLQYYYSHERLGFIPGHSVANGLRLTGRRFWSYVEWTPPFLFPVFLVSLVRRRTNRWEHLLFLVFVYLSVGYFLYYGDGGNQYGPRFLYESLAFVVLIACARIVGWYRALSAGWLRRLARALVLASILAHLYVTSALAWNYHVILWERSSLEREVRARGLTNAVVFVRDWIGSVWPTFPTDTIRNAPDLSDPVLLANDFGEENRLLAEAFPERTFFVATYDRAAHQLKLGEVRWERS